MARRTHRKSPAPGPANGPRDPVPAPPDDGAWTRADSGIAAGLAAVAWLLFLPCVFNDFVAFDDPAYVTANPVVQQGLTLEGVRWAFTTSHFMNWLPVTWLSHMLDVELFGLDPRGHHATSVALHGANAALAFAALRVLTRARGRSAAAAALFAVHPMRVESVAWIAERKDVLCATFFFLTLIAYAGYARRPGLLRYLVVAVTLALGLMAKTMLVTVPCLLLVLDRWPLGRIGKTTTGAGTAAGAETVTDAGPAAGRRRLLVLAAEKVPLFALSAIASAWTYVFQRSGGAVSDYLPLSHRAATALVGVWRYVGKFAVPIELSPLYPLPKAWPAWAVVGSVVLLVASLAAAVWVARRRPYLTAGWFWFLGMLVPVSGLIQVGNQSMADRYTYVPGVGLTMAVVWAAADLVRRVPRLRGPVLTAGGTWLVLLAALAVPQQLIWRTTLDLFAHALAVDDSNWVAHHWVGTELAKRGLDAEAVGHFRQAILIQPNHPMLYGGMGVSLRRLGRPEMAVMAFRDAIQLDPTLVAARIELGGALTSLKDYPAANAAFADAARTAPDNPDVWSAWASSLLDQGRPAEARERAEAALRIAPTDEKARGVLERLGQPAAR